MGGDADVDNFLDRTMSNRIGQRAMRIAMKAKPVRRAFETAIAASTPRRSIGHHDHRA